MRSVDMPMDKLYYCVKCGKTKYKWPRWNPMWVRRVR